MGYTHYWTFIQPDVIRGKQIEIEARYHLAVRQCQRIVRAYNKAVKTIDDKHPDRLSGYSAHCKLNDYLGLNFNGTADLAHETFCLRDHWSANRLEPMQLCKTDAKPYDKVVVACLITLKHYLGNLLEVSSDGVVSDWEEGLELAKTVLKIKELKVPASIRDNNSVVQQLQVEGKTFN